MKTFDKIIWAILFASILFVIVCIATSCKVANRQQTKSDTELHEQNDLQLYSEAETQLQSQKSIVDSAYINYWYKSLQHYLFTIWSEPDSTGKQYPLITAEQNEETTTGVNYSNIHKENADTSLINSSKLSLQDKGKTDYKSVISEKSETKIELNLFEKIGVVVCIVIVLIISFRFMHEKYFR
jgi:hypothetical protein